MALQLTIKVFKAECDPYTLLTNNINQSIAVSFILVVFMIQIQEGSL